MPVPGRTETRDQFISRCIPIVLDDGTAEDQDQAVAICNSMWEQEQQGADQGAEEREMDKTKAREHKILPSFVTKIDGEQGIVEHTVAVMGNVDLGGDRIHPGAFTKTITERGGKIRVLDSHNSKSVLDVLGRPLALWEIGREELPADVRTRYPDATGALMARTQFLMDTPEGKGAFTRIRDGAVDEYSIGYDAMTVDFSDEQYDGKEVTVRNLREIRLWEYSPVPFAMNPATSTLSAKEQDQTDSTDPPEDDPPRYVGEEDEKGASGSTSLPLADRARAWDATAAVARVRRATDSADAPSASYKNAFFWYDGENADQFTAYKLPFADVVNGRLTAIPRGIFAVAQRLDGTDIPDADKAAIRSRVSRYYAKMRSQFDDDSIVPPWDKADEPDVEEKAGRVFSARNVGRIRSAIGNVQQALSDLEEMLNAAMPQQDEEEGDDEAKGAPLQEAATGQDELAGPPDQAPTREELLAEIDQYQKHIQRELAEETT